jgi:hypothetical protein
MPNTENVGCPFVMVADPIMALTANAGFHVVGDIVNVKVAPPSTVLGTIEAKPGTGDAVVLTVEL